MNTFGRTNRAYPPIWFRPTFSTGVTDAESLGEALERAGSVVDIGTQPSLWGNVISEAAPLMVCGSKDVARSVDEKHAADLTLAHLIQSLSSARRERLEFYFLAVDRAWEEFQAMGALSALERARQEGHVRFFGLWAAASPLAALGFWQFHDAFEAILVKDVSDYECLSPLAQNRRVGILSLVETPTTATRLATVDSAGKVFEYATWPTEAGSKAHT